MMDMKTNMKSGLTSIRDLPFKTRVDLYKESILLRKRGYTIKEIKHIISKKFRIKLNEDTIYRWVTNRNSPYGGLNKFVPKPLPELSYVIGVFLGDGSICRKIKNYKYRIKLKVKDKDFAERFSFAVSKILGKDKPYKVRIENDFTRGRRKRYVVEACSKLLHKFLQRPLEELLAYAKKFPGEFLRGLFDSDGFTAITAKNTFSVGVGSVSTELKILKFVKKLLKEKYNISSTIRKIKQHGKKVTIWGKPYIGKKDIYNLRISKFNDVKCFINKIGFSLNRKQKKLEDAIFIKENFEVKEAIKEWKKLYYKVGREWIKRE